MRKLVLKYLALGLMLSASARAATNFLDFNMDPSTNFYKGFSAADDGVPVVLWRASGGATTGGATDGVAGGGGAVGGVLGGALGVMVLALGVAGSSGYRWPHELPGVGVTPIA